MNADTLKNEIGSIEQQIFAAETAERSGYEQLRQARLELVSALVAERPFIADAELDLDAAVEQIHNCWTSLLHHRWEKERPSRSFPAGDGWIFRAEGENPTTVRVSLEPAGLDEIEQLDGMPRMAMPIATGTAATESETMIHRLDDADLKRLLTRLVEQTASGEAIKPQIVEHLGAVA